eukprot:m.91460 g.91460  ORF g.91460 m.91460 type:complete len:130 (+) comp36696_c0_seq10:109-498(+)
MSWQSMSWQSTLDEALAVGCKPFGISTVYLEQRLAIAYLLRRRDVFACFPTGRGKSLFPAVMKQLRLPIEGADPAVLIVSSLNSLMRDQRATLRDKGISACQIGLTAAEDRQISDGEFSVLFGDGANDF